MTGYIPYYLGWTRSSIAATNAVGIHHPRGDIKKSQLKMTRLQVTIRQLIGPMVQSRKKYALEGWF